MVGYDIADCIVAKTHNKNGFIFTDDIGGIYLKHLTTSEGYQALIYFESCTPAELEEKIAIVEAISTVSLVSKIHLGYDDPTLD